MLPSGGLLYLYNDIDITLLGMLISSNGTKNPEFSDTIFLCKHHLEI